MAKELRFYTFRELQSLPEEEDRYLIDGLLWEHDHVILLGKDKVGKSILALQMACSLSCGESFLEEYEIPEPMRVAYIQTEGKMQETVERLKQMTVDGVVGCNPDNIFLMSTHSWQLDTIEGYNVLEALLLKQNVAPRVIFLDPLYMSMLGDLNDNMASRSMARNLRRLGETFNAAIILVHHTHRDKMTASGDKIQEGDSAIMGSFVWKAFPDHVIMIAKRADGLRTLSCDTQRGGKVIHNMLMKFHNNGTLKFDIYGTANHLPYVSQILEHMKLMDKPQSAADIQKSTGLSISAVRKSLMYLSKFNVAKVTKINPGKRPTFYQFNHTNGSV